MKLDLQTTFQNVFVDITKELLHVFDKGPTP